PAGTVPSKACATTFATNTRSSGPTTATISSLSAGSHAITAVYNGDGNFNTSTNSPALTQTVNSDPSTTTLTASTNTTVVGQSVTFTATVTGTNGTPTGSVIFM